MVSSVCTQPHAVLSAGMHSCVCLVGGLTCVAALAHCLEKEKRDRAAVSPFCEGPASLLRQAK